MPALKHEAPPDYEVGDLVILKPWVLATQQYHHDNIYLVESLHTSQIQDNVWHVVVLAEPGTMRTLPTPQWATKFTKYGL